MLRSIKEHATINPVSKTISYIAEKTGVLAALTKSEEDQEREENIKELIALSVRYDEMPHEEGIEKFLEDVSLLSDQDSDDEERDAVRLMTVHASKGLEFAYVFVVGLEEGLFPHERDEHLSEEDAEEERRLFYVAVTRAKKKLVLSYAQTRTIFGSSSVNIPSQFVFDIPEEYIEREFLDFTPRHKPLLHIEF
jgi:DNA helicase-2/ATP-dependent DNA helicase PcrA